MAGEGSPSPAIFWQIFSEPELLGFVEIDQLDHIPSLKPAQGTVGIAGRDNLVIGPEDEFGRLDDAAAVFPPRSQRIGDVAGYTFTDGEVDFVGNLLRFVSGVDACRDDGNAKLI
jgi:hypothetical protein